MKVVYHEGQVMGPHHPKANFQYLLQALLPTQRRHQYNSPVYIQYGTRNILYTYCITKYVLICILYDSVYINTLCMIQYRIVNDVSRYIF